MRRKKNFVCQHLEYISREALEEYQDVVRRYVRGRQGVYALYRRGKLYYVGLASNLPSRLRHHLKDRLHDSWDRFSVYLTTSDSHLREIEALVLRIVKPKGNRQVGKFPRSEDLRPALKKDIKQCLAEKYRDLFKRISQSDHHTTKPKVNAQERQPVLAAYNEQRPLRLRARFKGKLVRARVRRDGRIRFDHQLYDSPSLAASRACGRKSCNGWTFWECERAPGDWVRLDRLRR